MSFSTTVKVIEMQPEDMGAVVTVEPDGGGIDVTLAGFWQLHVTEDAAPLFKQGAHVKLTFEEA